MHCKFCGFANGEDDHRCVRCGRRIGVAIAAPHGYAGANALALAPSLNETVANETAENLFGAPKTPAQPALFIAPTSKIIPFDQIQKQAGLRLAANAAPEMANPAKEAPKPQAPAAPRQSAAAQSKSTPRDDVKKAGAATAEQAKLDFIPAAAPKARTLKTEVEAVIFCDQVVATPMHRFVAASIDAALILFGFGVFVTLALLLGGSFGEGKMFWITMASCFAVISLFYGAIWAVLGTESVGMRCTELQLITFDGFPVEGSARLFRFGASWLSFCSAGLGVLWALVDEENLTWHDHISKTFPTIREAPRNFVRQRR